MNYDDWWLICKGALTTCNKYTSENKFFVDNDYCSFMSSMPFNDCRKYRARDETDRWPFWCCLGRKFCWITFRNKMIFCPSYFMTSSIETLLGFSPKNNTSIFEDVRLIKIVVWYRYMIISGEYLYILASNTVLDIAKLWCTIPRSRTLENWSEMFH